jgi:DNA polymerase-3 subunit epsilon
MAARREARMPSSRYDPPPDTWVAIDFETATRRANSACALGIAVVHGTWVEGMGSWLIQPPFNEYEYRNTLVHGISSEDTALAPDFADVWWEIGPLLAQGRLLAHNAPFDIRVLRALIASHELVVPSYEYACTVALARKAFPEIRRHTLDAMCTHCDIALVHHDAASDAEACAHLALACAEAVGADTISEAVERLGVNVSRL